jgi:hypothetical protein
MSKTKEALMARHTKGGIMKAEQIKEALLFQSPRELIEIVREALEIVAPHAGLFGKGNQIDIRKAQRLVELVVQGVEQDFAVKEK